MKKSIILFLLVMGVALQVDGNDIVVSYKQGSVIKTSKVSKDLSACVPHIGQKVYFYKNYKIVECVEAI